MEALSRTMSLEVDDRTGWPLAGIDFFNTHAGRGAQKKLPFSPGANLGGFGLLRNGGNRMFEIMGQAGVFPAIYPNSAKMARMWVAQRLSLHVERRAVGFGVNGVLHFVAVNAWKSLHLLLNFTVGSA